MRVALLGAESTGKSQLAVGLAEQLRRRGQTVAVIAEVLREWCDREGRNPRPHEQEGIAREQARRVEQAPPCDWLIADTTPLMVAIYSELLFADRSLYPLAWAHQRSYHLNLVTGLDLPWVADGHQRDGPQAREPVDALLRHALAQAGIGYRVIYGSGEQRLQNALTAIERPDLPDHSAGPIGVTKRWTWPCEKCGDPACERRLFSALLARYGGPGTLGA